MFIAFEGPDGTGKSTLAEALDCAGQPDYNATKNMHAANVADFQGDPLMPHTYDRIDWFSHMVYRLALPDRDWNDDRPRTVFAMPDTHLVVLLHKPERANFTVAADDESVASDSRTRGVETPISRVNPMYYYFADYFMRLNEVRNYELFRTVSIVEVDHDQEAGTYSKELKAFSSPLIEPDVDLSHITTDDGLLAWLQDDDRQRL